MRSTDYSAAAWSTCLQSRLLTQKPPSGDQVIQNGLNLGDDAFTFCPIFFYFTPLALLI